MTIQDCEFTPAPLLRHRHTQSMLASLRLRRSYIERNAQQLLAASREHILDAGPGVRLQSSIARHRHEPAAVAVLIHGWEGSENSLYMLSAGTALYRQGFHVVRLNLRDHGDTHHLNRELFHACRLDEVTQALVNIQCLFPHSPMGLIGFSLGGNFAARAAARAHELPLQLRQTIAVCPVMNPHSTLNQLETGWFGYRLYFKHKWRNSTLKKLAAHPDIFDGIENPAVMPSLTEMTEHVARHHAGFNSRDEYLAAYSLAGDTLAGLKTPLHILVSEDDPVNPVEDIQALHHSPFLTISRTEFGGHCGFIERLYQPSWADNFIATTLQQCFSD